MAQSSASKTAAAPATTAMEFDGKGNHIDCGNGASLNLTQTLTIEAWLRCKPMEFGYIVAKDCQDDGAEISYALLLGNNAISWFYKDLEAGQGRGVVRWKSVSTHDNHWHHIALVVNQQEALLYVDGVAQANQTLTCGLIDNAEASLLIGKDFSNVRRTMFTGKLAEMRLWSTARTAEEIKAHMSQRLRGDEPGLVGYWPLDEGAGTTAKDKTKNDNHGTIHGATWLTADDLQLAPAPKPKKKTRKNSGKTAASDPTLHIPAAQPRTLHATGLEDYNYWWETLLKQQLAKQTKSEAKKPYRRGRIWV
ncbi:MAG: LamG-like jellyroll fold domain-containing protein [Cyanobacteria bacterium P01_D01_bin.105]